MHLHDDEPAVPAWEAVDDEGLDLRVRALLPRTGPALVLVDGRSGGGKTTFADRLARLLAGAVVHTDDLAWHHDAFAWTDLLLDGVVTPWRQGLGVDYRPPGWVVRGRPGSVRVPAVPVLVVEGVGAGRAALARHGDLVVWVQSDRDEARRRGLVRDVELGRSPAQAKAFWGRWMRDEEPFLTVERPWEQASLVVLGTPPAGTEEQTRLAPGPRAATS